MYCTTLNGTTLVIEESTTWTTGIDEALAEIDARVRAAPVQTGEDAVKAVVLALSRYLEAVSVEDALELAVVVDYPGDEAALPGSVAIAETVEAVVSTVASWEAQSGSPRPAES